MHLSHLHDEWHIASCKQHNEVSGVCINWSYTSASLLCHKQESAVEDITQGQRIANNIREIIKSGPLVVLFGAAIGGWMSLGSRPSEVYDDCPIKDGLGVFVASKFDAGLIQVVKFLDGQTIEHLYYVNQTMDCRHQSLK